MPKNLFESETICHSHSSIGDGTTTEQLCVVNYNFTPSIYLNFMYTKFRNKN